MDCFIPSSTKVVLIRGVGPPCSGWSLSQQEPHGARTRLGHFCLLAETLKPRPRASRDCSESRGRSSPGPQHAGRVPSCLGASGPHLQSRGDASSLRVPRASGWVTSRTRSCCNAGRACARPEPFFPSHVNASRALGEAQSRESDTPFLGGMKCVHRKLKITDKVWCWNLTFYYFESYF